MYGCDPQTTLILVASLKFSNEMYQEIYDKENIPEKLGRTYIDRNFVRLLGEYEDEGHPYHRHRGELLRAFDLMSDAASADVFYHAVIRRLSGNQGMHDVTVFPEYFIDELILSENEVFCDCGASFGDTVETFCRRTRNRFRAIYAFELDDKTFAELQDNPVTRDGRIKIFCAGVSDANRTVKYQHNNRASSYVLSGGNRPTDYAKVVSIDELVKTGEIKESVTFVKMDIEGAEMDALHGMEHTLRRDLPKLAICVYHKTQDLWEIPLYINVISSKYRMLMRHHWPYLLTETVLYCLPEA